MIKIRTFTLAAAGALMALAMPLSALAHGNSSDQNRGNDNNRGRFVASVLKAFNHRDHDDKDNDKEDNNKHEDRDDHDNDGEDVDVNSRAFLGTVTDIDGSMVTFSLNNGSEFTVNTAGVNIVRFVGNATVASTLEVNDRILVKGSLNGSVVTATGIRDLTQSVRNKVKGTVTAVNGNVITVQTKHNGSQDITTNSATTVMLKNGQAGSLTDIIVNAMIKASGAWNPIGSIFTASTIKIK